MSIPKKQRFLIWGKTYPELSTKYYETVCTGAVLEDGTPIQIYPIPFRYLSRDDQLKKYQWLTAAISKNESDPRPESHRIDCDSIELGEVVDTDKDEWGRRQAILFQQPGWQFETVEALEDAQRKTSHSLGVITPKEIISIGIKARPDEELQSFEQKRSQLRKSYASERERSLFDELMPPEMKNIEFLSSRIQVEWRSLSNRVHNMQIMDWEIGELQRRVGDQKALTKVRTILNLETHATRFFLGNLRAHPQKFTIIGLWYPKRAQKGLF